MIMIIMMITMLTIMINNHCYDTNHEYHFRRGPSGLARWPWFDGAAQSYDLIMILMMNNDNSNTNNTHNDTNNDNDNDDDDDNDDNNSIV